MNQLIFLLPILPYVKAQSPSDQNPTLSQPMTNFAPSMAIVILIVLITLLLTILTAMYAKFCHRVGIIYNHQPTMGGEIRQSPRSSGIDKIVIESLPFFKFSALKGSRQGMECAVCLSKFEDIEVLRLLPKCKHAFHISCVDKWLENHSSCPLCRQRISVEDLTRSNSLRQEQDSDLELFVQREGQGSSSLFSIGSSFRKFRKGGSKEDELPIGEAFVGLEEKQRFLHKFNHNIIMSGNSLFQNRWSNLSSSDLLSLSSEMLGDVSSQRFRPLMESNTPGNLTKANMGTKNGFETKLGKLNQGDSYIYPLPNGANASNPTRNLHPNEKRSMSERVVHSRFDGLDRTNSSIEESSVVIPQNAAQEERLKRLWLPIARKTIHWYATNRDENAQQLNYTRQVSNV